MYVIQTLNSDVTIRPLRNKNSGVQNHETAQRLNRRGMDVRGYGSDLSKAIGQHIKVCAPGHRLEQAKGEIVETRSNQVLCVVETRGQIYRVWFTANEVEEVV